MKKKILTGRAARISPTGVGRCGGAAVSVRKSNQGVSSASMKAKKMMTLATMKRKRGTKMEKLESTSDVCVASSQDTPQKIVSETLTSKLTRTSARIKSAWPRLRTSESCTLTLRSTPLILLRRPLWFLWTWMRRDSLNRRKISSVLL